MHIILVGLNHRTAPVALREQMALAQCGVRMALEDLNVVSTTAHDPNGRGIASTLKETVILSTCNRLEVYAVAAGDPGDSDPTSAWQLVESYLARLQGLDEEELHPHLYFLAGSAAADHLMRVASGLDSMILGEPQILGQVASALTEAQRADTSGPILSHLFDQAVHAGKRARTETGIGRHTTSTSHAAAQMASDRLGGLAKAHVLVVGAGEMSEVAARALQDHGASEISFLNRTYARAESLAQQFNGRALNWYHLPTALAMADVVVTATGAPHILIHRHDVAQILPERAGRPLLFVDIAVPRDVEEAVGELPGVYRFDIDHLQMAVDANLAQRQAAVPDVETIIVQEAIRFEEWLQGRQVLPVLVELRRKARAIADRELERNLSRLDGLDDDDQERVAQIVHRVVNKILHEPTIRLKASAAEGNGVEYAHALRELFDLNGNPVAAVPHLTGATNGSAAGPHQLNGRLSPAAVPGQTSKNGFVKKGEVNNGVVKNEIGVANGRD